MRLKRPSIYRTQSRDTLRQVAMILYGHKTWWPKLVRRNPALKKYGPDEPLPENLKIHYLAPEIGDEYIVHEDDWLIRIAQWKYGDSSRWTAIYSLNSHLLSNPNLIHPGDRLIFDRNGTITHVASGQKTAHPELSSGAQPKAQEWLKNTQEDSRGYLLGAAFGILFFFITPVLWWIRRMRQRQGKGSVTAGNQSFSSKSSVRHIFDGLLPFGSDLERRSGYFSLHRKTWKKYIK